MKKKTCPPLTADSLYAWCMFVCKVKIGFGIQVCSVTKPFRLLPPLSLSRGTCQHGPRLLDACVQMRTQRQLGALQCRLSLHVFSAFAFGVDIFNIIFHLILLLLSTLFRLARSMRAHPSHVHSRMVLGLFSSCLPGMFFGICMGCRCTKCKGDTM